MIRSHITIGREGHVRQYDKYVCQYCMGDMRGERLRGQMFVYRCKQCGHSVDPRLIEEGAVK